MAHLTLVTPETTKDQKPSKTSSKRKDKQEKRHSNPKPKPKEKPKINTEVPRKSSSSSSSSWDQIKNLLTCKQIESSQVHDPRKKNDVVGHSNSNKLGSSCGSLCSVRDVVHGNTRVVHRADNSPETSSVGQDSAGSLSRKPVTRSSARSNSVGNNNNYTSSSSKGMHFRKLSGCYECHMIVDPSRYPIQPRSTVCSCPQCGEVFPKIESLELHQAIRHAVSELGPEDSGRNIVEIIFKSSWLKKDSPIFTIERILKVHVTQRTIQRFEDCRDAVKSRAARKNPRCAADGNELLRFHCTTLSCSLGSRGSSSLCSAAAATSSSSSPSCGVCAAIRHGFSVADGGGVVTTASSGRAHDSLANGTADRCGYYSRRAMIVCRVIAGKVKRDGGGDVAAEGYDSVAGASSGISYNNLEELTVFNPRAILPCFVVIYKALGSQ